MSVPGRLGATAQTGALDLRTHPLDPTREALRAGGAAARARLGQLALAGVLLAGLVISIAAAHTDSLLPESVRPIPRWLAGPFGGADVNLHVGGLIAVLVLMFACYALAVQAAERLSARAVLMSIAALHALMLLAPPLLSTDVFSYQAYARMWALYGANPYLNGPHVIALDPLYPFIGAKWVSTPTAYGPIFTSFSYLLAPLSIAASALAYKAVAAVASLATVALVWNAARLRGVDPVKAAALVGLNPLIVVYGVGGGHNDLLMLALLMAGLVAVLQHRDRAGGALVVLGAGIKLTAGVFLPFAAASGGGLGATSRRREITIGASVAVLGVAVLAFSLFGGGPLHLLGTLHKTQSEGDWHSIPGFISTRLGLGGAGRAAGVVLGIACAATYVWLLRKVWRGEMDWIDGAGWVALALLITASSMLPWYVAWLMPLAALATDRRLWRIAIVMTGVVQGIQLLGYIPHNAGLGL
ncbi:MAG: polyprenol phosphomannose-dependent alpha 1,6 mannosyltransferase MptB [Solirubrobacterales bacterium]|nr:polyprenol phosphomannose-dependent alpha 1,6 mannosyltransferase MptB [Solirubrobacterales bacterium]